MHSEKVFVTKSLALNQTDVGAIVGIKGSLLGAIIRIRDSREIIIGRDGTVSDLVVHSRKVSRKHCGIIYQKKTGDYLVCDYSSNGTYLKDGGRLPAREPVLLEPGTELWLVNDENIIKLG